MNGEGCFGSVTAIPFIEGYFHLHAVPNWYTSPCDYGSFIFDIQITFPLLYSGRATPSSCIGFVYRSVLETLMVGTSCLGTSYIEYRNLEY